MELTVSRDEPVEVSSAESESDAEEVLEELSLTPPFLPDHPPLYRHLDPAAALAFRTPLQEHTPAADTKAAAVLTALGIMFPLLAKFGSQLSHILWRLSYEPMTSWSIVVTGVAWVALFGFVVASVAALVQAFRTFSPRLPRAEPSLAFFGDIASLSREQYLETVVGLTHDQALQNILSYNHNLSKICVEKFTQLRWALKLFEWAFVCWLVLILLIGSHEFH